MNINYTRKAFARAGFPLMKVISSRFEYTSSVVRIRLNTQTYNGLAELSVWTHGMRWGSDFHSVADALNYIKNRLSIECVHNAEYVLRDPGQPRPSLELIAGGAA